MSKFFITFILFISFLSNANEHQYKVGDDSYKLKYKVKEVTTVGGRKDLVLFSVYKNNKFVHSKVEDGGRFFSCGYEEPNVLPVKSSKNQFGWLLTGGGICGNTFSYKALLIIPQDSYMTTYHSKEFISKALPVVVSQPQGAKVLFSEQNWGNGGTAASFFVPRKLELNLRDDFFQIKKGNVLEDVEAFEATNMISFLGFFVAGMMDANPDLMQYALKKHFHDTTDFKNWIKYHFKKDDKAYFEELIEKAKKAQELLEASENIISSISGT